MIKSVVVVGVVSLIAASPVAAQQFGPWQNPVNANDFGDSGVVNSPEGEGCPILDPYTNDLFIASAKTGTTGSLDIWRAAWNGNGWGSPVNLGGTVNTVDAEFCPTPARGRYLYFVRRDGGGDSDIFRAKMLPMKEIGEPVRLSTQVNSTADEWSPSPYEYNGQTVLYFSTTRNGEQDIYFSVNFGPAQPAPGLAMPGVNEARPNISRDGLEIVFDIDGDIYTSSRPSMFDAWSAPAPISVVNTPAGESRASMSWDRTMLVYGSGGDIYVATREKLTGKK